MRTLTILLVMFAVFVLSGCPKDEPTTDPLGSDAGPTAVDAQTTQTPDANPPGTNSAKPQETQDAAAGDV